MRPTTHNDEHQESLRPAGHMTDLYAAAAARIIVTSKRSFVTSCGVRTFPGEAMAIDRVQPAEAAALEAAVLALVSQEPALLETGSSFGFDPTSTLFDPDVLLAWLLTEGVSSFH